MSVEHRVLQLMYPKLLLMLMEVWAFARREGLTSLITDVYENMNILTSDMKGSGGFTNLCHSLLHGSVEPICSIGVEVYAIYTLGVWDV